MKSMYRALFFLLFFASASLTSKAQFNQQCVDSGRVDPFFQCNDPSFLPVCGCNLVTYRNECVANRNGGVNFINSDGVCPNDYIYAEIFPTIVTDYITLYLQFYEKGSAFIQIRDTYGKIMFSQNYLSLTSRMFSLDRSGYGTGIYYVLVSAGNVQKILKFVVL